MFKFLSREPLHDPLASPMPLAATEVKTTTCYMCACRCGIRVHLRDGEIRYIEGNPNHPLSQGVICAKGASGIVKQVSPAVQAPGRVANRWFFFAQARHPQNLYYQVVS